VRQVAVRHAVDQCLTGGRGDEAEDHPHRRDRRQPEGGRWKSPNPALPRREDSADKVAVVPYTEGELTAAVGDLEELSLHLGGLADEVPAASRSRETKRRALSGRGLSVARGLPGDGQ
jgi:hypothetical protein